MYQMNNRVVANGSPLDASFDNIALAARRAGYEPAMFGYTDQAVDLRTVADPADPRLCTYEGVLPGFDCVLDLAEPHTPWLEFLRAHGFDVTDAIDGLFTEHERPVAMSMSTFTTDCVIEWLDHRPTGDPWFAHVSYLRPHPPYRAAGDFATMYDPADCPPPLPVPTVRHPMHDAFLRSRRASIAADRVAHTRSQYYGMISEVDAQLGRLWEYLRTNGEWGDTVVVVTADHGEQLGDQGLIQKLGWFSSSYHIVGIWRDPRLPSSHGTTIDAFTENIDVMPTLCDTMGIPIPAQCDGWSLMPWLRGENPASWRDAAYSEWDWRDELINAASKRHGDDGPIPGDRHLERCNLAVRRSADRAYVQFGDGSWRCYDLATDPTWNTEIFDPAIVLAEAQAMLTWRSRHLRRELANTLLTESGPISVGPTPTPTPTASAQASNAG
jgi:arylsulfatase A-like enzyme